MFEFGENHPDQVPSLLHAPAQEFISNFRTEHSSGGREESFKIGSWQGKQNRTLERVSYNYISDTYQREISGIVFEGWRRYPENRRDTEGGRFIFKVRSPETQAKLARVIAPVIKDIGWMEPLYEDPIVAINFCETEVEGDPDYIDQLFNAIAAIEEFPRSILSDLIHFIAYNCVDRFKERLLSSGFEAALPLLRTIGLKKVLSPYYVAALSCLKQKKFEEARELIKRISDKHWQHRDRRSKPSALIEQTYRREIQLGKKEIQTLKAKVKSLEGEVLELQNTKLQRQNTKKDVDEALDFKKRISQQTITQQQVDINLRFSATPPHAAYVQRANPEFVAPEIGSLLRKRQP